MSLPNYGNIFPDDILGRIRDLEDRINQLTGGTFGKVTVAGDVTGLSDATTVERLQGSVLSSAAPSNGDVLRWAYDGEADLKWRPGDVEQLQGRSVATTNIGSDGVVLTSNGTSLYWNFPQDGLALFGSGVDGAKTITQATSSVTGMTKSGSGSSTVFTLNRDMYFTTLTLDDSAGSFAVRTNGYKIFCTTECIIDALVAVRNDGSDGTTGAGGGAGGAGGAEGTMGSGSQGSAGSTGTASVGNAASRSIASWTTAASGGDGGSATGGPGTGGGAAGGAVSWFDTDGTPHNLSQALMGGSLSGLWTGGAGGAGGNGSSGTGGGGGGGGGIVAIFARKLLNDGSIHAEGGDGGSGDGTNAGGGGGGSGGAIVLIYRTLNGSEPGATFVSGGTGGARVGTGKNGEPGDAGYVWNIGL